MNTESNKCLGTIHFAFSNIDRQWPNLKYYSMGFYSAWILLTMGGNALITPPVELASGNANNLLYLYSGIPLAAVLILCGIAYKRIEPFILRGPFTPLMAALASVCTFLISGGFGLSLNWGVFVLASIGTGIGTPILCLRIGNMYSTLDSNRVIFATFSSGIFSNLLYFTCRAINPLFGVVFLSCMPMLSMVLALLRPGHPVPKDESDVVPACLLPRGFFIRCILFVAIFAMAVGLTKGLWTITTPSTIIAGQSASAVFVTMIITVVIVAACAIIVGEKHFDLSKLYYPIITIAALGSLLAPLLGDSYLWLQAIVVTVTYNLFTLTLWCLFSNIAGQTDLSPTRVFGLGRGASALGTTLGQFVAMMALSVFPHLGSYTGEIGVGFALLIILMAMFMFDEKTLSEALEKTFLEEADSDVKANVEQSLSHDQLWKMKCAKIAESYQLTQRETDVLELLARGRTAKYISESLCIAQNTTKGHIKNLYAKCDVHSRQELIDLLDKISI